MADGDTPRQLPLFHNLAGQPVLLLGDGDAAAAKARLIERAGGRIVGAVEPGVRIAFVALDDETAAIAAAAELKAAGLIVNVVDRPALCDFTTPAIVDRHPVLIAIGTGGASAGLAKALRQRLEMMVPATLGTLATALSDAREALRVRWPDGAARRRGIDTGLAAGGAIDPLADDAAARVAGWLAGADDGAAAGVVTLTLTSADPDDLTLRAARLLGGADVIVHDAAVPPAILARARADAVRIASQTLPDPVPGGVVVQVRMA